MNDVRTWLQGLGLGQYADAFEVNDIIPELLPQISDQGLKDIGVASLGHRLKILAAIQAAAGTSNRTVSSDVSTSSAPLHAPEAERRQLTVMFCDLVGSTELSQKLDPEALRELMRGYQHACGQVIEKYEGHVAQYLGDGLMVYFGWPSAHEDDAERAVRTGLEILAAVKQVAALAPLRVRIGIATGAVVVGETGAGDASVPKLAVGDTPNLAARLQSLAGADEVVIAPSTHRLVGAAFEYVDLGERILKGIIETVRPRRVAGIVRSEGRFEAVHAAAGLTPFIGRDSEVAMLLERWSAAKDGEGQVVLLCGEPGIGKSRITQELRARIADERHMRLRYQCSPYHVNSPFHPIIEQLERAAGFDRADTAQVKLDKLEAVLALGAQDVAAAAPLYAALLSLPHERYPPLELSPQRQKEKTIEALADQVVGLASAQPVVAVVEDAHWCDPTTLEALSELIARARGLPILLIVTYRPEFQPPWPAGGSVTAYTMTRLSRRLGADLVVRVTAGKRLPEVVLEQIVAKTDGIPLFVEELTKTVLEAGFLKETAEAYVLAGPLPPLAIPATLHDSLMARLDRLTPVKEVAQIGACIGREFAYELLAAVSPLGEDELQDALQQLVASELVFRRGVAPQASYTFKHALVQDAAYSSLLKSRRATLHRDIASTMVQRFPGQVSDSPEVVAQHYTEAGLLDLAVPYWHQAGDRARRYAALGDARRHYAKALQLLNKLEPSDRNKRAHIEIVLKWVQDSLWAPTEEVAEALLAALAFCKEMNEAVLLNRVKAYLGGIYYARGDMETALEYLTPILESADEVRDAEALAAARLWIGNMSVWVSNFARAIELLEKAIPVLRQSQYSLEPMALAVAGYAYGWTGRFDKSYSVFDRALTLARAGGYPSAEASAYYWRACICYFRGLWTEALADFERTEVLAQKHNDTLLLTWNRIIKGYAAYMGGRKGEGVELAVRALREAESFPGFPCKSIAYTFLAEPLCFEGQLEEARALARKSLACAEGGDNFGQLMAYRVLAMVAARSQPPSWHDAVESIETSIRLATERGARPDQAIGRFRYAEILADMGEYPGAKNQLDTARQAFEEMGMMWWPDRAQELAARLAPGAG